MTRKVCRLVMLAFIGERPPGCEVCHNDGDPTNNCLDNLRYDTHRANMADKRHHGTLLQGEGHPRVQLNELQVREIHRRASEGTPYKTLAAEYDVHPGVISSVLRGRTWKHLDLSALDGTTRGERSVRAKLTKEQVREVHQRCSEGEQFTNVAAAFGLSDETVRGIAYGTRWKHLKLPPLKKRKRI